MMTLETTRGAGKTVHRVARWVMLLLVLQFQLGTAVLFANPVGEQVVAGQAGFDRAGSTLTINQGTQKVVINWQDFSIQQGEITKFLQPNSSALALNRVVGGNLSQIYGTLQANGTVIVVNPNGLVVGPGGLIDVGSFVGSTLDLSNDVFMKGGDMSFSGDSKNAIQNFGKIQAEENVFLFAQKVDNQGKILAGKEASLAAGSNILLKQGGNDRVSVLVGSSDQVTGEGIRNSGEVQAAMVTMKATGSAYSAAVNNEGLIRATGAAKVGGRVLLTGNGGKLLNSGTIAAKNKNGTGGEIKLQAGTNATKTATVVNSGTLDATGTTGGKVEVTGDRVALTGTALVDVSGTNGGGTALIGGGWQGKDSDVQNADRTYVASGAQIKADSEESGDAGTVVVWSDRDTRYFGDISAQAKGTSGSGGDVEVSGKTALAFNGSVNTAAANGQSGTILLDPQDIFVGDFGVDDVQVGDSQVLFADSTGSSFFISDEALEALTGNILLQASRDVFFNFGLNLTNQTAGETLTVQAGRSVEVATGVGITLNGGSFSITINDAGAVAGDRTAGLAEFLLDSSSVVTTNGGNFTVNVGTFGGTPRGVSNLVGTITAGGGNISITGVGDTTGTSPINLNGASLTTTGAGSITLNGTSNSTTFGSAAVVVGNNASVSAVNGLINITGSGSATSVGTGNNGVNIIGATTLVATSGSGGITVTGNRGSGNADNRDVLINGGATVRSTATGTGAILIQSGVVVGTTTTTGNRGIQISGGSVVESLNAGAGASTITLNGSSGVGTGGNIGVIIDGASSAVRTVGGNLSITGIALAGNTGANNSGVVVQNSGAIQSTGAGLVNVTGTTNATGLSTGVQFNTSALISSTTSNITIMGTNTTGGAEAVSQFSGSDIVSTSGNVTINASGLNSGYVLSGGGSSINAGSGNVDIVADTVNLAAAADGITTTGDVSITTFTAGRDIDLGTETAGRLSITDAEVDEIFSTNLFLGDAASGDVFVTSAFSPGGVTTGLTVEGTTIDISAPLNFGGAGRILTLNSSGLVSQTVAGVISAGNAVSGGLVLSGAGPFNLGTADNVVNRIASDATGNVTFRAAGDLTTAVIGLTGFNIGANALVLITANGDITDEAPITAGNATFNTFNTAGQVITLDTNNQISGTITATTQNADIALRNNNTGTTTLGNISTGTGAFDFTAGPLATSVVQAGATALTVGGNSTFTTQAGTATDLTLNSATNNLSGTVAFTATNAGSDVTLVNSTINNGVTNGTQLAASTVGGNLNVTASGSGASGPALSQTGALTVGGQANFTTTNASIGSVTLRNDNATGTNFGVGNSVIVGNFTLNSSVGPVTQSPGSQVRVQGAFNSASAQAVNLTDAGNIFGTYTAGDGSLVIRSVGDLALGNVNITGSLTALALRQGDTFSNAIQTAQAITLNTAGNSFGGGLVVNTGTPTFNNTVAASNNITQNVATTIQVAGTSTFRAVQSATDSTRTGTITTANTGNLMTGAISYFGTTVNARNAQATVLGASTASAFTLNSLGAITNTGALNVSGASSFTTLNNAGAAITLNNAGNTLQGGITLRTRNLADAANVNANITLVNDGATDIASIQTLGNAALTKTGVAGNLTQSGLINANTLTVTSSTTATLTNVLNTVANLGAISVSGGNFSYYDADGFNVTSNINTSGFVDLGTTTGTVAQTGGTITSNGLLLTNNGAGTSTFTINQPGNAVATLAARQTAGGNSNITFINDGGFAIGTVNAVSGVTAGTGNVNLTSSTGAITRAGSSAVNMGGGTLTLTADTGVGTAGTPILTTGTHTLTGSTVTSGGFFTQNDTSGNVTVGGAGITAPGSIRVNNTFGSLTVNQAINSTAGGNITLDSGTTMTVAAAVGSATANNITINNAGLFDSNAGARLTTGAAGVLNFSGAGQIGVSAADAALVSTGDVNFNRTTATSDAFVSNDTAGRVRGNINGNLDFRSTGGNDITIGNTTGPQNLTMGANGAPSSITVIASGQILSAGTIFANGADVALQGSQVGTSSVVPLVLNGVNILEARATGGGIFLSHSGSNLTVGEVSTALAGSGMSATGNIELNQGANQTITIANNIATPGNINVIIAFSGPGADQLFVNPGVTVGSGAGGSIIIGGGVNNQGNVTATAGSTTTLDGGRPNLTLGGIQNFNGDVTFSVIGDIEVTGRITQTSATGSITLISDSDLNNTGGIIITNEVDNDAFIKSAGTMNMTASQLAFTALGASGTLGAGNYDNVGIGIAVLRNNTAAGPGRDLIIVGGAAGSGDITMTTRPAAAPITVSDIIIEGVVQNNVAGTNISIDSSDQIQIGDNVTSVNNLNINNAGSLTRTTPTATLRTGGTGTLLFEGAGQLGVLGTSILTRAGNIDFDSSSGTKAAADAFISEFDGVGIIGELDELVMTAAGTVTDIGLLDINQASIVTTSGSIVLNNFVHNIDQFNVMTAVNNIFYTGGVDLILADAVSTNASGSVTINVVGQNLNQLAAGHITSNNITLVMDTGTLNATIDRAAGATTTPAANVINITNTGLLTTSGVSARITANTLNVDGSGDVGNNLSDGLNTSVGTLVFDKTDGDLYIFENTAGVTSLTGNMGANDTLNVSTATGNINVGIAGITTGLNTNVHLIAAGSGTSQVTQTPGGFINMDGGELLLVARNGIGIGTTSGAIQTTGEYTLAALNTGTSGGVFVINQDGTTTSGTDNVTIGSITAFTPAFPGTPAVVAPAGEIAFDGVRNQSTATTGFRDIAINNNAGNIILSDQVTVANSNQNVQLVANEATVNGRIIQGLPAGVVNSRGGRVLLVGDSGVGEVNNAIHINGNSRLTAQSVNGSNSNIGGIYVTNLNTTAQPNGVSATGTVTIGSATDIYTSTTFNGLQTLSAAADADIRLRNAADPVSTTAGPSSIVVDDIVQASVGFGGNTVALIADNGSILQGTGGLGRIVSDDNAGVAGEVLLAASRGIGTLATPLIVQGHYNLGFRNDTPGFTIPGGVVSGNVNILNNAVGPISGFGNITVTQVNDVFTGAGVGVNLAITPTVGGRNFADAANSGAIRLRNTNTGADTGDIFIANTTVSTTGTSTGTAFIEIQAEDDVIIVGEASAGNVTTANGSITMIAGNANASDTDGVNGLNTLLNADGIYIGSPSANSTTLVQSGGASGAMTLTATANLGRVRVSGGDTAAATTLVQSSGAMTINATGAATGPGTLSATDSSAALLVQGGTGNSARATVNSTNTGTTAQVSTLGAGGLRIQGGSNTATLALMTTTGRQTSTVTGVAATDSILIQGGTGSATATLSATGTGSQLITLTNGNMLVTGGDGSLASAQVSSAGVNAGANLEAQRIIISAGNLLVDAGNNVSSGASASIDATNTGAATQFIDVEGTISVLGGDGGNEQAFIRSAGFNLANGLAQDINSLNAFLIQSGNQGVGNAFVESTGAFGRQQVTVQTGNLSILAGTGGGNSAFIRGAGNNGATIPGQEAQRIIVSSGNLIIDANSGTGGNTAFIDLTNATSATQFVDVEGTISVLGGDGGGESARIRSAGFNTANGLAQDINSLNAFLIQSGNSGGGNAFVESTGAFGRQQIVVQTGNLSILAGTGGGNSAFIRAAGDNGATLPGQEAQRIIVSSGNLIIDANSGTGGNSAFVDLTNATSATQVVDVEGTISVLGGDGGGEQAFIRSAGFNAALGLAQDINALSGILLEGGNAAGGGNAFIDATGLQGRQQIVVQTNDLTLLGGTGSSNNVRILSAGLNGAGANQEAQRIIVSSGNIVMNAGNATNGGSTVAIRQTNSGSATQFIDVDGATAGTITLTGGGGSGETATISAAGFNAAAGTAQDINALNGISLNGGLGANAGAFLTASGLQGSQLITVQNNNLSLLGGNGTNSDANITGAGLVQTITVSNGNLTLTANQDAANADSDAVIQATNNASTQTINVSGATAGLLTLLGGAGTNERAQILGNGIQGITVANGITVTGGSGTDTTADITKAGDAMDTQTITVTVGNFAILGGTGSNANAGVNSNGLTQTINVNNGALTVQGDQTNAATANGSALVSATNLAAVQTLNVTNGGILVRGGVGTTEGANIQMVGANGRQTINLFTDGDLVVEGGDGLTSVAQITSAGLNNALPNQEAQRIIIGAGQLIVRGNQSNTNNNSSAIISQTNTGAASQVITVNGLAPTDGTVSVLGGAGINELALISSAGNALQTITIAQGLTITGGSGTSSTAGILSTGTGQVQSVVVTTGSALLTGGTANSTTAFIDQTNNSGTQVVTISGASALSDLTLTGGNGTDADARITAAGTVQTITVSNGDMSLTANQDAANTSSDALVRATNNASTQTISVAGVGAGTLTLLGGAGTTELAQIFANGIQGITVANGITVTGGSGSNSTADIIKTGDATDTQTITVTTGDFDILGGTGSNANVSVQSNGVAQTINVNNGALTVQGDQTNAATANGSALVSATNTNAVQTLNVTNGGVIVRGGVGTTEGANIQMVGANGRQTINLITDGDLVVEGGNGATSVAQITSAGLNALANQEAQRIIIDAGQLIVRGNQNSTNNNSSAIISQTNTGAASQIISVLNTAGTNGTDGTVLIEGGDGTTEIAQILSNGTVAQNLTIARGLTMQGGDGNDSTALITSTGLGQAQRVTVTTGNATLTGGTADNTQARIEQTNAVGTQLVEVLAASAASNLALLGGTGINADAAITAAGTTQTLTVSNGALTVQADQTNAGTANADALVEATNTNAIQLINVTNGGIIVRGGVGTTETARIAMTGTSGRQTINLLTDGDFVVEGGNGATSTALVTSAGLNAGAGTEAQRIIIAAGQLIVRANQDAANANGSATISQTNAGAASQIITVNGLAGTDGTVTVLGGAGINEDALISSAGTAAQTLTIARGLAITGGTGGTAGAGTNSTAGITAAGTGVAQSITVTTGNATLTGGTGGDADAFMAQTAATGTQVITISGVSASSNLALLGGNGLDSDALVSAAGTVQTITVSNGNLTVTANQDAANANSDAIISATNNASTQTINVSGAGTGLITLLGGAGTTEIAQILANGVQAITAANGITVTGGSGTDSTALITKAGDATDSQTITVTTGNFDVTGGTGTNADARVASNGVTQTINVNNGALRVRADQTNGLTANADAVITATNAAAVQTLNVTNGGIQVIGGVGSTELATISMTGANGRQTINLLTDGDLLVEGGNGTGSAALITSAGINGGAANQQAQRIIIDAGQLTVRGNQDATNGTASATISQTSAAANTTQFIQVSGTTGTDGRITVLGGAGTSDSALISSVGRGTPGQQISAATDLTVQGGTGTNTTAGITHNASILSGAAGNGQTLTVGGNALVQGGSGQGASALIQTDRNQALTVTGNLSVLADTDGANGGGSAEINQASPDLVVTPTTTQVIIVNGAGGLIVTGGAASGDFASINKEANLGSQTITVANAGITVNGGSGLAVTDNFGRIRNAATGAQAINWNNSSSLILNANQGSSNDGVFGPLLTNYGAAVVSVGNQNIGGTSGGPVTLNGGNDTGAVALIGASGGTQSLTVRGPLNVNAGSANQTSAQIRSLVQQQTLNVAGNINVTGSTTAATDNFAIIRGGLGQSITTTAGGDLVITANASSSAGAEGSSTGGLGAGLVTSGNQVLTIAERIDVFAGSQDNAIIDHTTGLLSAQTITAGDSINLADGTGGDAVINSASLTAAGQQINATGSINLTANDGRLARVTSANNQLITTAATLNLSGDTTAGSEARINAVTSTLNINGAAASVWNGTANYLATTQATINNTGAITVNETAGFTGGVTTPLLIFVTGNGAVGGTNAALGNNTRLRTTVDTINFNAVGTKTVNLRETDDVALQGEVNILNLVAAGNGAGDTVTNSAALDVNTSAVIRTLSGDVNLANAGNTVNRFDGLISDAGSIVYNGASATTFANRTVSADIPAGPGVFAQNDITITLSAGAMTVTAGQILSNAGDMTYTAAGGIVLAGGTKFQGTAPGPGDGLITTLDGTQTYNSAITLNRDYFITASGVPDTITFNSTIDGLGGLGIGSTPNFNGNIGATTPLAYLFLNSPANSNFNANNGFVVTNGSIVNQGGGRFNINGTNMTFIVDAGNTGVGPGVFTGGLMDNTLGGTFTIFAASPAGVSGSLIGGLPQVFDIWTVSSPGVFDISAGTIGAVNFKTPDPFDPTDPFDKNRLVKRRVNVRYDIAYQQGGLPSAYYTTAGLPDVPNGRVGGLMSSSYDANVDPIQVDNTGFVEVYQTR